jgi:hypothetical protein
MTVTIKKTDTIEQARKKMENFLKKSAKARKKKGFPAHKFAGLGIFKGIDPLEFQKKVRNEWDR